MHYLEKLKWVAEDRDRSHMHAPDLEPTEECPRVAGSVDRVHVGDEEGARGEVEVRVEGEDGTAAEGRCEKQFCAQEDLD